MMRMKKRCGISSCKKWLRDIVIYSGAVRRKRVSKQVTPVDAQNITGLSDIKYGSREEAPKSHLRVASSPGTSAGSVGKAGITRAKRTCRASRLIVWKMAYCLHLPTTCTLWPYPTTLYIHTSLLLCAPRDTFVAHYAKDTNRFSMLDSKEMINNKCTFTKI